MLLIQNPSKVVGSMVDDWCIVSSMIHPISLHYEFLLSKSALVSSDMGGPTYFKIEEKLYITPLSGGDIEWMWKGERRFYGKDTISSSDTFLESLTDLIKEVC
jgi:hypothetical protein